MKSRMACWRGVRGLAELLRSVMLQNVAFKIGRNQGDFGSSGVQGAIGWPHGFEMLDWPPMNAEIEMRDRTRMNADSGRSSELRSDRKLKRAPQTRRLAGKHVHKKSPVRWGRTRLSEGVSRITRAVARAWPASECAAAFRVRPKGSPRQPGRAWDGGGGGFHCAASGRHLLP